MTGINMSGSRENTLLKQAQNKNIPTLVYPGLQTRIAYVDECPYNLKGLADELIASFPVAVLAHRSIFNQLNLLLQNFTEWSITDTIP